MALSIYITDENFGWILDDLNIEGTNPNKKMDIMSRAVGSMESDLSAKFVVPLRSRTTNTYVGASDFARAQVLNCLKAKIRSIIGIDKNRNLAGNVESTTKFQNVHEDEYRTLIKKLLDYEIDYGFCLQKQAVSSKEPVQHLGLARSKVNSTGEGSRD